MKTKKIASVILIMMFLTWGCNQGSSVEQESSKKEQVQQKEQVQVSGQQESPSGESDKFGRKPGDAHYGHNHSSTDNPPDNQTNTQQKNTSGEPDKFGRKPGDKHYGHGHE